MTLMFGLVVVVLAGAFVVAPFFTTPSVDALLEEEAASASPDGDERARLERQKREAYAAIKEAEFDHRMAKLSDNDFAALRQTYESKALEAIAALKAHGQKSASGPAPAPRVAFCPGCGTRLPEAARFCPSCGFSLEQLQPQAAS